ncbi:hypothetical protein [Profundibacter sp.]
MTSPVRDGGILLGSGNLRSPYRIDIYQPGYFVLDQRDDLLKTADRDLLADVATARALGLFAQGDPRDPGYPPKQTDMEKTA